MKIIHGLLHLGPQSKGSVVTIGVFDGLHLGHRATIRKTVEAADRAGLTSVLVTFDPHPAKILTPSNKVPSLISVKHRMKLIGELGIDTVLIIKFTGSFSKMAALARPIA